MSAFDLQVEEDGLAVLTFDLAGEKVNKFSTPAVAELGDVLVRLTREARIRGLLIRSGKPDVFIAGADVKEFSSVRPEDARTAVERVQSLFEQLAHLPYPTIAAINGVCLGGGTELALACDYRLMSDGKKAQIGLPEVRLGIFPAWGGCTRLPRLVGLPAALDLILTGKSLDARRARRIGLVDEAVPAAILEDYARRFARSKLGGAKRPARRGGTSLSERALEATPLGRRVIFSRARDSVMKQTGGHYPAPLEALEVIEEGYGRPVADGLAIEARHIGLIFGGEVQRNLLAIYFLTEEVKKETGVADPSVRAREVARVGVLGAGVMGGGIAQLAADKGLPARMKDIQPEALGHGYAAAAAVWKNAVRKRRLTPREMARKMDLLSGTLDYSGFPRCEVTIEAVVEKLAIKRAVLKEWEAAVPKTAIFASNTSTLPITEIAAGALEPGRVVGMHFFNPVHRMPLVEVIRGERTSDETVATVFALAKTLGKTPVVVRDAPGFLVNRILAPYLSEAVRLVQEGCRIEDVDAAMTAFGMPVGPLALLDDVGLDVAAKGGEVLQAAFPERLKMGGEEALAASGRLGRKNGKGFYEYEGTSRRGPAPEAYAALRAERRDKSPLPGEVIEARLVLPMINEASFCLEDEIVAGPARLDLAMIFGTGFPPFRGGLLRHADAIGLGRVFSRLDDLAERLGPRFAPSDLIQRLANARRGFYPGSTQPSREIAP
ncbi:MAG TPA: 3-hydroxyacyl-CoA dehydrogenase NAD-binding domain-containing protein [Thermoanaerobaculia bacterium]|jgi:3-hydroxyacyl-CoA dehydrogenase/enoyl-CoA hydratase/3-hydroxybutyryl-CoA epimerase|nr:3-hydroxyacyl-CoA dehydrogenase NAD-binding domain-containing protein [Thermoanaerobaculia bacterium]